MTPPRSRAHDDELPAGNRQMGRKLAVVVVLMFGFGFALVPMYRAVCSALGVNVLAISELDGAGVSADVPANGQVDMSRTITVEFDANAHGPWDFKPALHALSVHPGELATVMYEFRNRQARAMTAQAIPSYAPAQAMPHFRKLECFCFSEHTLKPGESKQWPVVFVIDPKLPKDIKTITLSYTFFEVGGKVPAEPQAAGTAAAPAGRGAS
jgi:cytochrome c oxidase assembly protein subunit 11